MYRHSERYKPIADTDETFRMAAILIASIFIFLSFAIGIVISISGLAWQVILFTLFISSAIFFQSIFSGAAFVLVLTDRLNRGLPLIAELIGDERKQPPKLHGTVENTYLQTSTKCNVVFKKEYWDILRDAMHLVLRFLKLVSRGARET